MNRSPRARMSKLLVPLGMAGLAFAAGHWLNAPVRQELVETEASLRKYQDFERQATSGFYPAGFITKKDPETDKPVAIFYWLSLKNPSNFQEMYTPRNLESDVLAILDLRNTEIEDPYSINSSVMEYFFRTGNGAPMTVLCTPQVYERINSEPELTRTGVLGRKLGPANYVLATPEQAKIMGIKDWGEDEANALLGTLDRGKERTYNPPSFK